MQQQLKNHEKFYMIMIDFDQWGELNHNPNTPYIPGQPYRTLIVSGTGEGNTNALLNLTKHQRTEIEKIYLYINPLECQKKVKIKKFQSFNGR